MPAFRIDSLGELTRQLSFTPSALRLEQINAAEALLYELDAGKGYPLDFVVYRITGYHPKRVQDGLFTGLALQHDLGLLIEQASASLKMQADASVLSIEQLTLRFKISTKTIQRWRRRGLAARRFVFADGKMRLGFLLSTIEKFLGRHPETVANWAQLASQTQDSTADDDAGRLERLLNKKVRFIDDPLYHQPEAQAAVDAIAGPDAGIVPAINPQAVVSGDDPSRLPRDLPVDLQQQLYRMPLLTPAQERGLFLKLNFHKYRFVSMRRKIDPPHAPTSAIQELQREWKRVVETRNRIVRANLRLVASVARKHLRAGLSLMELVSEGNLVLIRAVNGFDVHRNTRFSTYATLALMKGFARTVPQMLHAMHRASAGSDALPNVSDRTADRVERQRMERDDVEHLLSWLNEPEREVLRRRFGLNEEGPAPETTLRQTGGEMGLSAARVGQIQKRALSKLRRILGMPR